MRLHRKITLPGFGILLLAALLFGSCSIMAAKIEEDSVFENQQNVKTFLEGIAKTEDNFSIRAFSRKTQVRIPSKRSELFTHSFYLIDLGGGKYHSLSFVNLKTILSKEGVWALDKDTDLKSYQEYIEGENKWKLWALYPEDTIDAKQTLTNIIDTINSGVKYYYKDHIKHRPDSLNCNTALYETVVLQTSTQ